MGQVSRLCARGTRWGIFALVICRWVAINSACAVRRHRYREKLAHSAEAPSVWEPIQWLEGVRVYRSQNMELA